MPAPPPPPPPPLPPPAVHNSAPSDSSLDSDDAKSFPAKSGSPSRVPPLLPPPPSSPAGTSLSRASDVPDDDGNVSGPESDHEDHHQVSDSDSAPDSDSDLDHSSDNSQQSASETYYHDADDLAELTRDDPATWKSQLVTRSDVLATYDSAAEDSADEVHHPHHPSTQSRSPSLTPPRPFIELKPLHLDDTPQSDHFASTAPRHVDVEDMDDLDVASDDRELELITGVHERASSPLSRPHSFPASNSSPASETSEMHRRKPVRPAVEILPDEWDGIEQHESSLESARSTGIAGAGAENVPCKNGYADWGDVADDQLSLEELQVEADEVTAAIEDAFPSGKPPLGRATPLKSVCADKPRLQKRMRDITAELANVQMATAGWAADAEGSIGSGDEKKDDRLLRDEVGRLRITLNHLTRLTLERAFEVRDAIDAHR